MTPTEEVTDLRQRLVDAARDIDLITASQARVSAELAKARSDYQFMVDRAADEKLDGYRELGARAAAAENARDDAQREAANLEKRLAALHTSHIESFNEGCAFEQASFHKTLDRVGLAPALPGETACARVRRHFQKES